MNPPELLDDDDVEPPLDVGGEAPPVLEPPLLLVTGFGGPC